MKPHKIYVYGTLRPGGDKTVQIPGIMYDLGGFPGIKLMAPDCGSFVTGEIIEADDAKLKQLDRYEGYNPCSPETSLYLRKPYLDGYIYEYNANTVNVSVIKSGDWLAHKNERVGRAANLYEEMA